MESVQQPMAGTDIEAGKIFVGGLSWETSTEKLKKYFETYGEISDCVIMNDPVTKRPRGFGFVTFKDPQVVTQVTGIKPHMLDGKAIDPKPATQKGGSSGGAGGGGGGGNGQPSRVTKKVFVGGIASTSSEDEVREYFGQFGTITEVELKYDKATQRMRGFGFVGFDSEDVVDKLCQQHFHQIGGKTVEVKKAEPKHASQQRGAQGGFQPYGGNIGRGNYGYGNMSGGGYESYGQQPQQAPHYGGYGYGQSGGYGQAGGYDYSAYRNYSSQQPASGSEQSRSDNSYYGYNQGQQQLGNYADSTAYAGTRNYSSGTENYGQQATYQQYDPSTASYNTTGYGETQPTTGYGRGAGQQQRGGTTYHYPSR